MLKSISLSLFCLSLLLLKSLRHLTNIRNTFEFIITVVKMHGIFFCKADSIIEVSLPGSHCVSVRHNITSNKRLSIAISRTCNFNERVFNKVIVIEVSVTA